MSKAFLPGDAASDSGDELEAELEGDGDDGDVEAGPGGASGVNYITPRGFARLRSEVHNLLHVERPKVVETVAWAASNGDRSENADYTYGKKRLREIDRRLRFLQGRLDRAQVVDPREQESAQAQGMVRFGATVKMQVIGPDGRAVQRQYRIGGVDETDIKLGIISWRSPVGHALLQAKVGDVITVQTPRGEDEIEILDVRYEDWTSLN
jgi:transcription elongation factor GreB